MKAFITNPQCLRQLCGFGEGATWGDAVKDALVQEPRAYVGSDGRVYIDLPVSL